MARNWPGERGSTVMRRRNSVSRLFVHQSCASDRKKRCSGVSMFLRFEDPGLNVCARVAAAGWDRV